MLGLRGKIFVGFGGLLLVLLACGVLAEAVVIRSNAVMSQMFTEHYGSVLACQQMKEAVEQIDIEVRNPQDAPEQSAAKVATLRTQFQHALSVQRTAITLPGELEATDVLEARWRDYCQQLKLQSQASHATPAERGNVFDREIYPFSLFVRQAAQNVIDINTGGMEDSHEKVIAIGNRVTLAVGTLMLSAAVLAVVFASWIGRIILRPVRILTQTVKQIEQGNLDLAIPVRSRDELGTLSSAMNAMATRLSEYRRNDHERLLRTERTTQLAIDSLPDAVIVVAPDGMIELANEAAHRLFGLSPGTNVSSMPSSWLAEVHSRILRLGHATELNGYESTIEIREDGIQRFFLPRTAPIMNEGRRAIGATIVLADVTGLRRLDETKNGLLSLVSHELKTPLTSTRMILHLVAGQRVGPLTDKQLELLRTARDDADRLHRIVENLLDMSRIEAGKALMEFRPILPAALAETGIEPLAAAFTAQCVTLVVQVPADLPAVRADAARVGHVFVNLLNNALRHSRPDGTVTVTAQADDLFVEFSVADDGEGIPRQYVHRIFEKFFRVPGQSGSGSGLGLALSKDIVEAHGGQIRAESPDTGGTVVRFALRRADKVDPTADAALRAAHA